MFDTYILAQQETGLLFHENMFDIDGKKVNLIGKKRSILNVNYI